MTVPPPYPCLGKPVDGFCPATPTYPARECTSGCSWWGSQYQGKAWPTGWGDALNWPAQARRAGFTVDTRCTSDSIMCVPPNVNGAAPKGHVAYVTGTPVNGHVSVVEINFLIPHGYDFRNEAPIANCAYIHLVAPDPPPPPIPGKGGIKSMYQRKNGTIYFIGPNGLVPLGTGADATYLESKGYTIIFEADLTVAAASAFNAIPVRS